MSVGFLRPCLIMNSERSTASSGYVCRGVCGEWPWLRRSWRNTIRGYTLERGRGDIQGRIQDDLDLAQDV
jgi:hypothetical protein